MYVYPIPPYPHTPSQTPPTKFPPFLGMTLIKLSLSHMAFSMTKNI